MADTLRRDIAEKQVRWKDQSISVTASFGVTTALPSEVDVQTIIARADAAMYLAKEHGRNCVRISETTA